MSIQKFLGKLIGFWALYPCAPCTMPSAPRQWRIYTVDGLYVHRAQWVRCARAILKWRSKPSAPCLLCALRHLPSAPHLCLERFSPTFLTCSPPWLCLASTLSWSANELFKWRNDSYMELLNFWLIKPIFAMFWKWLCFLLCFDVFSLY